MPPTLTYDLVVLKNPCPGSAYSKVKTFCRGRAGEMEALFYSNHRLVESSLTRAMHFLNAFYQAPAADLPQRAACLTKLRSELGQITEIMRTKFEAITADDFDSFRIYFKGSNGHPGPSGLFSGNFAAMLVGLFGEKLGDRVSFIQKHLPLYTRETRKEELGGSLSRARANETLIDLLPGMKDTAAGVFEAGKSALDSAYHVLLNHFVLVQRIAGNLFAKGELGSAGKPANAYLADGARVLHHAIAAL